MSFHTRRYTAEHHDHERDLRKHEPRPTDILPSQIRAVASLIVTCEALCESGLLGEKNEMLVRERVASALAAFGMCAANRDEREAANAS